MSNTSEKMFFKNKNYFLRSAVTDDHHFIYELIKDFLKMDLSVTFLKMPSFDEFFKNNINLVQNEPEL